MTRPAAHASLGSEFEPFLFAPIGDGNGTMPLSVLSALARLDVDPWEEAARLAKLPAAAAARKLTSLIEALPDAPAIRPDLPAIAVRLIALLPRSGKPVEAAIANARAGIDQKAMTRVILLNVLLISLAMGIQGFIAWHTQPPHIEPGHAPSAETEPPQAEPPIAGQ